TPARAAQNGPRRPGPGQRRARSRAWWTIARACRSTRAGEARAARSSCEPWQVQPPFVCDIDRPLVARVGMTHDTGTGIVREYAFEREVRAIAAIRDDDDACVERIPYSHAAAVMETHPRGPAGRVEQRVEKRPVGDRVRSVPHTLCLAIGRSNRPRIEVIATDDDRCLDLALADHLVEGEPEQMPFLVPEPADAGRQALEADALRGVIEPAQQPFLVRKQLARLRVRARDVLRVA